MVDPENYELLYCISGLEESGKVNLNDIEIKDESLDRGEKDSKNDEHTGEISNLLCENSKTPLMKCSMVLKLPDNEQLNTHFVQAVEKYPCLYNNTLKAYSNRSEQEKAWEKIASEFSSTGTECKNRWKNLRGGLTRYIKMRQRKSGCGSKLLKPYYLWDVMQFILPYTKSRAQSGKFQTSWDDNDQITEDDKPIVDELEDEAFETDNPATPVSPQQTDQQNKDAINDASSSSLSSSKFGNKLKRKLSTKSPEYDNPESSVMDFHFQKGCEKSENPDLSFFKSILPDLANFDLSQKRRFKLKVLEVLEAISSEEPLPSSNSSAVSSEYL